ncbi:MAG: universal stress protein [Acidimicrobiia bacterium]
MLHNILLAVDGSDHATKATDLAADLAKRYEADLTVLHVMSDPGSYTIPPSLKEFAALERVFLTEHDLLEGAAESIVERAAGRIERAGLPRPKTEIVAGHPAYVIVDRAAEIGADMILMGSRGLGGIESMLLGSTSHKVAHLAGCTVVTVK